MTKPELPKFTVIYEDGGAQIFRDIDYFELLSKLDISTRTGNPPKMLIVNGELKVAESFNTTVEAYHDLRRKLSQEVYDKLTEEFKPAWGSQ